MDLIKNMSHEQKHEEVVAIADFIRGFLGSYIEEHDDDKEKRLRRVIAGRAINVLYLTYGNKDRIDITFINNE